MSTLRLHSAVKPLKITKEEINLQRPLPIRIDGIDRLYWIHLTKQNKALLLGSSNA